MSINIVSVSSSTCFHYSTIKSHRHASASNPNLLHHMSFPFPTTILKKKSISHLTISRDHMPIYIRNGLGSPSHSPSSKNPWSFWVAGVVLSAVLSIWKTQNRWGPLLMLKQKVEEVVDMVEDVAEMVEKTAERVDKVAEEVAEHLAEGSELKKAAHLIEKAAERIAKHADFAGDIIDKVQEVEDELSRSFMKQNRETKEDAKQKNDQTKALKALKEGSKGAINS